MNKRIAVRLALLLYVLSSPLWGPAAEAAFHLEYEPGVARDDGMAIPVQREVVYQLPPKPVAKKVAAQRPPTRLPVANSGRCGGDLPPCWVMMRESRGDPNAYNPTGCSGRGCYGKWQFDPRTGDGTGSEAEQDAEARRVWDNGRGCSHWAAC